MKISRDRLDLVAATLAIAATAAAAGKKPKIPIGIDPGGIAVAVIGDGIDYTRPDIASRLARDGEGEIIGFDLVNRDRLPFVAALPGCPGAAGCAPEHPAETVLRHAPAARIAIFLVARSDARQSAEAIAMAARSPARIVLLQEPPAAELLREAAQRFPMLQFVVPPPETGTFPPDLARLANVTVGCRTSMPDSHTVPLDGACASAAVSAAMAAIVAAEAVRPEPQARRP